MAARRHLRPRALLVFVLELVQRRHAAANVHMQQRVAFVLTPRRAAPV
jgi:hypothetical protein